MIVLGVINKLYNSFRHARNMGSAQIAVMTPSERIVFERYQLAHGLSGGAAGALGFGGVSHIEPPIDMDAINQRARARLVQKGHNFG